MCGIGGILRRDGEAIPDAWLDSIDARIGHRGPDGQGRFRDRVDITVDNRARTIEIALVHRRLSIIDPDTGQQPMVSERGRTDAEGLIAVVFNGCIYNHRSLRDELEDAGHVFASDHSDTEVIIHGYRAWGRTLTDHLEGMYAFALWDRAQASLVLARDWFGEKPLYVRQGLGERAGIVAFSSEPFALAQLGAPADRLPRGELRPWTETYLQLGYNYRGVTVYGNEPDGVRNLPPTITRTIDTLMPRRSRETTQHHLEALLDQAVQRRLESDVPLGCFLSGGVDSSLIAHFAREHLGDLHTFSVSMPDVRYDESQYAAVVAAHLGTRHTTLDVSMDPANDLRALVRLMGQPFGDSSILPTYWVSRAAREHVSVALSGDGGDELFIGYERYLAARHLHRHRRLLQWVPRRWLRGRHPTSRWHKFARLGEMARDLRLLGIAAMESIFNQHQIYDLLGDRARRPAVQSGGFDPMQSLRQFDLLNYLPDDLMTKVDAASMAVALEVRTPYLDRDLVRAALAAPTWQLAPGGRRKGLLRAIARKYLPEAIVDRPKMGFAVPIGEWLRDDFGGLRSLLLELLERDQPFGPAPLRMDAVRRIVDAHLAGEAEHGQRLFALLTLALWAEMLAECRDHNAT